MRRRRSASIANGSTMRYNGIRGVGSRRHVVACSPWPRFVPVFEFCGIFGCWYCRVAFLYWAWSRLVCCVACRRLFHKRSPTNRHRSYPMSSAASRPAEKVFSTRTFNSKAAGDGWNTSFPTGRSSPTHWSSSFSANQTAPKSNKPFVT